MHWEQLLSPVREGKNADPRRSRTSFEQDFDRIIFSHPFRKLQDKTQVFPLPEEDFVHTRLTHSLEVSSVGRSLGRMVGEVITERHNLSNEHGFTAQDVGVIVAAASLAHDIGNPPFGHSGEQAISEFFISGNGQSLKPMMDTAEWTDLCDFEGNAQGFRLLTAPSLSLTSPVLGAFTKYPRTSDLPATSGKRSHKKYGVFQSEKGIFDRIAQTLGLPASDGGGYLRHPLAFLVEAADDICYHIIDLEDGCTLDLIDEETTRLLLVDIIGSEFNMEKYKSIPTRRERIGMLRALAINKLAQQTVELFLDNEQAILSGDFDTALTDLIPSSQTLGEIIDLSIHKLYRSRKVLEIEAMGFNVLNGLLDTFLMSSFRVSKSKSTPLDKAIHRLIPEFYQVSEGASDYQLIRRTLDYISGMTDSYALSVYRKIHGAALPGV